ncbi:Rz1-like lysis system protein LysC [Paraburkholderia fungorum]
MKTRSYWLGPILLCLLTLPACQQTPLTPAQRLTVHQCQTVTRCTLPAMSPRTNGEMQDALETAKGAWATCAAKIDMIVDCQNETQDTP